MKSYIYIVCLSFVAIMLSSCSDRPENIPSDSKMVSIMADIEMAQAYIQNKGYRNNTPENRERILEYVLDKNGMTREDFDSTLSWYGRHIDKYDDLYARVDKELARRESRISGNNVEILSNDLWPYSRHLVISSKSSNDSFVFNLPANELGKGDFLMWKFRMNAPADGNAIFGVRYSNGRVSYVNQSLNGNNVEVSLQTDTALSVKEIFGNLRVKLLRSFVGLDSLTLTSAPFDSTLYYRIHSVRNYYTPKSKNKPIEKKDSIPVPVDSVK